VPGPNPCLLTQTDLALTAMVGAVDRTPDHIVAYRPRNPGYRWGNFLFLRGPPPASSLQAHVDEFRQRFADHPAITHVTLRWDGDPLTPAAAAAAQALGMTSDGGLEMVAHRLALPSHAPVQIRELDMVGERDVITAFNVASDPSEQDGAPDYVRFKERIREEWWTWHAAGAARWWGAFAGDVLVGQCGLVSCPDGLGRFQAVETHPEHRRQGVCSALVATVGHAALTRGGCRAVLLGADAEGPALGLYKRMDFRPGARQHSLLLGGDPTRFRPERAGDHAEVRAIVTAAFGQPDEAALIAALRDQPGVISLVAERGGDLLGHALFSPVTQTGTDGVARRGIALGPVAVRPSQQRKGVGSALIRDGLARARAAGWTAAIVLGDPHYYGRFGWTAAARWDLDCQWTVPPGVFQAMPLVPEGLTGWRGLVRYHPAFDELG